MLDALNSQMRANQVALKQRAADDAAAAAAQLAQRETQVQDLKEQVLLYSNLWLANASAGQPECCCQPCAAPQSDCCADSRGF